MHCHANVRVRPISLPRLVLLGVFLLFLALNFCVIRRLTAFNSPLEQSGGNIQHSDADSNDPTLPLLSSGPEYDPFPSQRREAATIRRTNSLSEIVDTF